MGPKQLKLYNSSFCKIFKINDTKLKNLKYNDIPEWDSIGHMTLMSALETEFSITLDTDDIIDFSSFERGKEILKKYKVEI